MTRPRFHITQHAIERYIERFDMEATFSEAESALRRVAEWARPIEWETFCTRYSAGGRVHLVVRECATNLADYAVITCITADMSIGGRIAS